MGEMVRLQKFLASAAIASRREAEEMILNGRVSVNGRRITELGVKIDPDIDHVEVDGKPVMAETEKIYVLFYKPQYCLTTKNDPQGRRTVYDLLKGLPDHLAYVGRLDWDAEGALILTNDGEFVHRLTHPAHKVHKTYEVKVKGLPDNDALDRLRRGIRLKDGKTAPAEVEVVLITEKGNSWLRMVIYEGRKNQIKRMINAIGHRVIRLVRTHIGDVFIGDLMPGQWRYLTDSEVESLRNYEAGAKEDSKRKRKAPLSAAASRPDAKSASFKSRHGSREKSKPNKPQRKNLSQKKTGTTARKNKQSNDSRRGGKR